MIAPAFPTWTSACGRATIYTGDCLDVMRSMPDGSVDAVVTDPPYGLAFMGKEWDHGVPGESFWIEALRVAKPGAHLLAFGGTRTFHRLTCALEDAGWEIRDCLSWLYGSGFPKSLDVSKAMDKAAGAEREVVGQRHVTNAAQGKGLGHGDIVGGTVRAGFIDVTAPATDLARQWQGWGTALKPAWEPVILARKPLIGTVAANVTAHGTGALNIDGCRLAPRGEEQINGAADTGSAYGAIHREGGKVYGADLGRWPANVLLDEDAAAALDEQSGAVGGAGGDTSGPNALGQSSGWNAHTNRATEIDRIKDSGGASRFFYTAKASRSEREAGLREAGLREAGRPHEYRNIQDGRSSSGADYARPSVRNVHPTVKPVDLMRWLVRLVTPLGGVVLDPFLGSGTTLVAALQEGCKAIGIEREAPYVEIAKARVAHEAAQGRLFA